MEIMTEVKREDDVKREAKKKKRESDRAKGQTRVNLWLVFIRWQEICGKKKDEKIQTC